MARRLLLLADSSHASPWSRANGQESAMRVSGLGSEDRIHLVAELADSQSEILLEEGTTSILIHQPRTWLRYQIRKVAGERSRMTSVEVLFG